MGGGAVLSTDLVGASATGVRRADIQGLRAVAVVLVVGFHVRGWIPGGFVGVDVFFVVSGFVITSMLRSRSTRTGTVDIRAFFARRARRLLPMLAVTLVATSALGVVLLSPLGAAEVTASTAVAGALLNANTFLARQAQDYFALPADANALLHVWSLSVEEQFYLAVPFVAAAVVSSAARRSRAVRRTAVLAMLVAAALVSFALFVALSRGAIGGLLRPPLATSPEAVAFYSAPTRAWEFLVGAILAGCADRIGRVAAGVRAAIGVVGLAVVVGSAVLLSGSQGLSGPAMLVPVLGAAAVLASGVGGGSTPVGRLLSARPLVAVGDVSYGWYLFHWPLIVFAEANSASVLLVVAAAPASLGLAFAAKRPIEDRFRHASGVPLGRTQRLGAVCVLVPVVVGSAAVVADRAMRPDDLVAAGRQHVDSASCNRRHSDWSPIGDPRCAWATAEPVGDIVLIGDSHASMWSEAVIAAGNERGYDVHIATMSGCPMVGETVRRADGEPDEDCQRFIDESVEQIVALDPALVMVGTGAIGPLFRGDGDTWLDERGRWVGDPDEVAAIWERGLGSTVRRLRDAGVDVALFHDVPYHDVTTATCGRLLFAVAPQRCSSTVDAAEFADQRARSVAVEDRVALAHAAATIDPEPWLCPGGRCSTRLDGTWMYRDGDHLSVAGSEALAPELDRTLQHLGL